MEVVSPTNLGEALRVKAERPDAVPIQGGTDVMVELNFDRGRPDVLLNLNEVDELRGWSRENGSVRLCSGLTYSEAMEAPLAELLPALAEAARTVGSPQIRNRGTIGGNLGTASPAGDALPPLLVEGASVELASVRGVRTVLLRDFLVGPKRNAAEPDELITAVRVERDGDRSLLARSRRRPGVWRAARVVRLGRAGRRARRRSDRRPGVVRPAGGRVGEPHRRRARNGRLPTPCAARSGNEGAGTLPGVRITITINGESREADVWPGESLLFALRERLGLPGSKNACEQGECGSCSVLLDGQLVCACLVLAAQADGHEVVTVEGLRCGEELHAVQQAFVEAGAVQCGFCTPGLIVATVDLLARIPNPSEDEIREALSGNLCRCTGYAKIFEAVRLAAG
jgi:aerobic carbon-monoxide dehydrogenase small subunit